MTKLFVSSTEGWAYQEFWGHNLKTRQYYEVICIQLTHKPLVGTFS